MCRVFHLKIMTIFSRSLKNHYIAESLGVVTDPKNNQLYLIIELLSTDLRKFLKSLKTTVIYNEMEFEVNLIE